MKARGVARRPGQFASDAIHHSEYQDQPHAVRCHANHLPHVSFVGI